MGLTSISLKNHVILFVIIGFIILVFPGNFVIADNYQHEKAEEIDSPFIISTLPVIIDKPGNYMLNISDDAESVSIVITSSDVRLDGMGNTIGGNYSTGTTGINISGTTTDIHNISIKNITLQAFDIGIQYERVSDCVIEDIILSSNLRAGIQLNNCSSFFIFNSEIKNTNNDITGGYGLSITDSQDMKFQNVRVHGNGKSGKSNSGGIFVTKTHGFSIIDSDIQSNPGTGIRIMDSDNTTIKDNTISINSGSGVSISNSDNLVIYGCVLEKNKGTGLDISSSVHPSVINNQINYHTIGLSVSNSKDMFLSGNSLNNNRIGFDISASDIEYLIHSIDQTNLINSRKIIYLTNEKNRKIGLSDNPAMIIAVNSSNLTISDLIFSKNGAGIILAACDNTNVRDSYFMDNGIGIKVDFGSEKIQLSQLHAEGNLVCGYYLSETGKFSLKSLYGQESPIGVYIKNSHDGIIEKISMSQMTGAKSRLPSGMTICNSSDIHIEKSLFTGCTYAGLISDTKNLVLSNNSFLKNDYTGSVLINGPAEIRDNAFVQNADTGVIIQANESKIMSNSVKNNGKKGLVLINSQSNYFVNNFFQNVENVIFTSNNQGNTWNNSIIGSPDIKIGGNYWGDPRNQGYSDICSVDSTGFCDNAYIMNTHNIDYHPLSAEYSVLSVLQTSDLNQNGRLELQDVVVLMNIISSGKHDIVYDFSGDGRVNLNDVVALFQYISNQ